MWTWTILSITRNISGLDFTLSYRVTNGTTTEDITEAHVSATPPDDIKSVCIRICDNAVNFRNRIDDQKAAAVAVDVSTLIGTAVDVKARIDSVKPLPMPISQDEIDLRAFQQLLVDYRIAVAGEALGLAITPDSATCLAAIQKQFKPEYRILLFARG